MRLWTIHPRYLDARGLVALWREALLARAVLRRRTRGYRRHPQLIRFRVLPNPVTCMNAYLRVIYDESVVRGYRFDRGKLGRGFTRRRIPATTGQLAYEWAHLKNKLKSRNPRSYQAIANIRRPSAHPLFAIRAGPVQSWERPSTGAQPGRRLTRSARGGSLS
jgi:Pyrimidine dimer DNA glycosylase